MCKNDSKVLKDKLAWLALNDTEKLIQIMTLIFEKEHYLISLMRNFSQCQKTDFYKYRINVCRDVADFNCNVLWCLKKDRGPLCSISGIFCKVHASLNQQDICVISAILILNIAAIVYKVYVAGKHLDMKHCQVEVQKEYFCTSFSNHREIS